MGCCRLGLAVVAALCLLIAVNSKLAQAQSARPLPLQEMVPAATLNVAQEGADFSAHSRRTQSVYCYPRNHWWFYRPYTTAREDYARCMPYFHYLDPPYDRRGARSDRSVK